MNAGVGGWLARFAGFAAVFSLYAHTFIGASSQLVTPIVAAVLAAALLALAVIGVGSGAVAQSPPGPRTASAWCLALALCGFVLSTVVGWSSGAMRLNDWGVASVEVGTPVLLFLSRDRAELLRSIGVFCVVFGLADAAANGATALGLGDFAGHIGIFGQGYGLHYLGLTGNSDASGMVAYLGASYLAVGVRNRPLSRAFARWLLIGCLLASLILTGARRYEALGGVSVILLAWPRLDRVSPLLVVIALSTLFLLATFTAAYGDLDNELRGRLMIAGIGQAAHHPVLGAGVFYKDPSAIQATFDALRGAGVTESGLLDLAISFGIPAAILFALSAAFALASTRPSPSWPSLILTMMGAELAFGDALTGFLGAILFYGCLIYCQRDEWQQFHEAALMPPTRGSSAIAVMTPA